MRISNKLKGKAAYSPGGKPCAVVLNANESFVPFSEGLKNDMRAAFEETLFNRYPDARAEELCAAFGQAFGVDSALVTAGNGSDELIDLLYACWIAPGDRALTLEPDFSMYTKGAEMHDVTALAYHKDDDFVIDVDAVIREAQKKDVAMIIFSNPCNPTGIVLPKEAVLRLVEAFDGLVVVDEAYMEFSDQSVLNEVGKYENLVVLKTCSKAYAAAALRIGFAVAPPALTQLLQVGKGPYNVGRLAQALATCILKRPEDIHQAVERILESRDALRDGLSAIQTATSNAFQILPSQTNFILIKTPRAEQIFAALQDKGVLIRCMDDNHLRVCAGTSEENTAFLDAFAASVKEVNDGNR